MYQPQTPRHGTYVKQKFGYNYTLTTCHFDRAWRRRDYAGPHDGAKRRNGNVRLSSRGPQIRAGFARFGVGATEKSAQLFFLRPQAEPHFNLTHPQAGSRLAGFDVN